MRTLFDHPIGGANRRGVRVHGRIAVVLALAACGWAVLAAAPVFAQDKPPAELAANLRRSLPASIAKRRLEPGAQEAPSELIKVVGGKDARKDQFRSQAAIILSVAAQDDPFSGYFCGGTLIAPRWVLTAAHCTYEDNPGGPGLPPVEIAATAMNVHVGSHDFTGGERIAVQRIVRHEQYDPTGQDNDIALLALASEPSARADVEMSRLVGPRNATVVAPGRRATVVGWGSTSSGVIPVAARRTVQKLQYADDLQVKSEEDCNDHYLRERRTRATAYLKAQGKSDTDVRTSLDKWYPLSMRLISDNMICAGIDNGSMDACFGDSGGPLHVVSGGTLQVGVVSWGPANGCGLTGLFGVYTRISNYSDWIATQMAQAQQAACPPQQLPNGEPAPPDWCLPGRRQQMPPIPGAPAESAPSALPAQFRVCVTARGNCAVSAVAKSGDSCWCPLPDGGAQTGSVE